MGFSSKARGGALNQLIWVHPFVGVLFVFIIPAFWWRFYKKRHQSEAFVPASATPKAIALRGSLKLIGYRILPGFYFLSVTMLVLALMRPQQMFDKISKNYEGIDIVIALDVSDSMLIEDMKPINRLESAKQTLIDFVKGRASDRIGIVIFAGEAFTLIPMTLDYELIQQRVSEITTAKDARIKDGTALGVALANSSGRLKDSKAKSRVVIFLTDGENNSGTIDPETGLAIAKQLGLKVYSIAIGMSGPTRIPIYRKDIFGNKIKDYQPFVSTVNEELLQKMADQTGGRYYNAATGDALQKVFQEIDSLEKTKMDVKKYTKVTELFPLFLKYSFWLLLFGLLLEYIWLRRWP